MYGQENFKVSSAVIRVMGIGGGGCNAVNSMIESSVSSAEFISVNTDNQALLLSKAEKCIQIGERLTKGLGAGSNPDIGEAAAEESKEEIQAALEGTDLLFIAAGMGGGTGTGAASVIARIAREMGILTVAVVTKPFSFEGRVRNENANKGVANLRKYVDTLVIIPNDKLLQFLPANMSMVDAFKVADDMLKQGIIGIVDLIATPSLINLDFADVNTVMRNQGLAHMGIGRQKGENRIIESVRQAVSSPLLETTIEGAKSVILNVTGGKDLMLSEVNEAAVLIQGIIDPSANIIFGATIDENMADEVKITVIATGFVPTEASNESESLEAPKEVKPALQFKNSAPVNADLPPLLREIEEEERKAQTVKEIVESVESKPTPEPVVEVEAAQPVEAKPEPETKGRELPAFMRKLFRR
ncbi:MAG: cell division protein FtsZ [Clostridiales bacterium]|nr:cell division protein FtsZ [Clostridiales bacterium]